MLWLAIYSVMPRGSGNVAVVREADVTLIHLGHTVGCAPPQLYALVSL